MTRKLLLSGLLVLASVFYGFSQISYIENLSPTSVSNDGIVTGSFEWAGSYYFWNPDSNTPLTEIGGNAAGNGVGGQARFSADDKFLSGTKFRTVTNDTTWQVKTLTESYDLKALQFLPYSNVCFAAGHDATGKGVLLLTKNSGKTWLTNWKSTAGKGIESVAFYSNTNGYACGQDKFFASTSNSGTTWTESDPTNGADVKYFSALGLKTYYTNLVVAAVLNNDSSYIYYTIDGQEYNRGIGFKSTVVNKIFYFTYDSFFLVTSAGEIEKTEDGGATWTSLYKHTSSIYGINFYDEQFGVATTDNGILVTVDGGETWDATQVANGVKFNDVTFVSNTNYYLAGSDNSIYATYDGGEHWYVSKAAVSGSGNELYAIGTGSDILGAAGSNTACIKSLVPSLQLSQMARYDVQAGEWTLLGSLNYYSDNSESSGYAISGDGSIVVGNAYIDPTNSAEASTYTDGFAWSKTEGVLDLGSMYGLNYNRSARANGISADGSVIVGWQDLNGPWKSAVWRKNPAGGYYPNEFLLIDPAGSATDEYNQLGEASCASDDGTWIGGYGDYALPSAWIWSEATGVKKLDDGGFPEGSVGYVSGMNSDASIVVGWYQYDDFWTWTSEYFPFIWTKTAGLKTLNKFIAEDLGLTGTKDSIFLVNSISKNGKFLTGWGVDLNEAVVFGFRLDISSYIANGLTNNELTSLKTYPNPMRDYLAVENDNKIDLIECYDVTGKRIIRVFPGETSYKVNTSALPNGVYNFKVTSGGKVKNLKVIK